LVERTVFEEVLRNLAMTGLDYYGFVEEEDGRFCWLFLEDVGDQRYSPLIEEHRILAAKWLATMHTAAENMPVRARLADRGSSYYLDYLRSACRGVLRVHATRSLGADDKAVLENIVSMCEFQGSNWNGVERFCDPMPRTLIHGDCLAKNVHVRTVPAGLAVVFFDWGGAGWGLPATDLGQLGLPYRGLPSTNPDCATYRSVVRDQWPSLGVQIVQQLGKLGRMFWALKVISLEVDRFDSVWAKTEHTMNNFRVYESVLTESIRSAVWNN
jgi:hypothetical protein